jgi:penicillin-insensitive murein endopeptidase
MRATARRRLATMALVLSALVALASPAATQAVGKKQSKSLRSTQEISLRPPPGMRSRSVRFPWDGRLLRGMRLPESNYVRYVPEYAPAGHFFGTWELVQLLERAARRVAFRFPGSRLPMGEISHQSGGDIGGHHSHESGRDADIGFYMTTADGRPYEGLAFANFDAQGRGMAPNEGLRFDDARNWELISKLISDGDARPQYIFVARTIKQRLLREAERRRVPMSVIERAASVMVEPSHGHPHRNHFHLRVYCAPADRPSCKDVGPFWPWYPGRAPAEGASAATGLMARAVGASSPLSSPFGSLEPHDREP